MINIEHSNQRTRFSSHRINSKFSQLKSKKRRGMYSSWGRTILYKILLYHFEKWKHEQFCQTKTPTTVGHMKHNVIITICNWIQITKKCCLMVFCFSFRCCCCIFVSFFSRIYGHRTKPFDQILTSVRHNKNDEKT